MPSPTQKPFFRSPSTLLYLLMSVATLALAMVYTAHVERQAALAGYERAMGQFVDGLATNTRSTLAFRKRSIQFLSEVPPVQGLRRAIAGGGMDLQEASSRQGWERQLSQIFTAFLSTNADVFKVRYVGVADQGRELLHVEREGDRIETTPADQLQQLGGTDYVQHALQLKPGQVYISDISLNREHGQVREPHRPTVRIAAPVLDDRGRVFGAVVINIDVGAGLLNTAVSAPADTRFYITNTTGDFIVHPDSTQTFGFDLGQPRRWSDQFGAGPVGGATLPGRLQAFQTKQGLVYAVSQQVPRQDDDPFANASQVTDDDIPY